MRKRLIFLFSIYSTVLFSQKIELSGVVKDSLQKPLSYANVIAQSEDKAEQMKFSITDEKGYYELELKEAQTYKISVHFMGYQPFAFQFKGTKNTVKNIVLKEDVNQLGEVTIELPVTIKGDTTTYKTASFTSGKERKLKQVLKKLPGVEVERDGKVYFKGKKVNKLLVDGNNFFGGGTKLGVENIPANAVDKVEMIENYNEIPFLKNITDSDQTAMNIKLKEDKKQFVFGDVEVGKGNKSYYNTHSNLFYYSPKTNVNFIGNLNNMGRKTFTFEDYMNFQGGISAIFSSKFKFRRSDFSTFMEDKDLIQTKHRFGAFHFKQKTDSNLDISGYGIFSSSDNKHLTEEEDKYAAFTENIERKSHFNDKMGIANLILDYQPNSKERWYSTTQYKIADNAHQNTINSLINNDTTNINMQRDYTSHFLQQNVEWHKKQNSSHTFSFTLNGTIDKYDPQTFWKTNRPILQGLIPIISEDIYLLHQQKMTNKKRLNGEFKHFWVLNHSNHIYTTLGNTYKDEQFTTNDYQELKDGTKNAFSKAGFDNDVKWKMNDLFLGLHYKFRVGIFTFKQGAELHRYIWKVNANKYSKTMLLPDFKMKVKFSSAKSLDFNYKMKNRFFDISNRANHFYLRSYNTIYKGDATLQNGWYHSLSLWYHRFSLYRGVMLSVGGYYDKEVKGIQSAVAFKDNNRYLTSEMVNNPEESMSVFFDFRKKIKKIKYKLKVNASRNNYLKKINNEYVKNKSSQLSYKVAIETLFNDFPTIEIGLRQKYGIYLSSKTTTKFLTTEPFAELEYYFLDDFTFKFDYSYYRYQNKTLHHKNTYQLANTSLSYQKEDSPWSFKIEAQNLFNQRFKQSNTFSTYIVSDTKTYILPRIVLFSIGYHL